MTFLKKSPDQPVLPTEVFATRMHAFGLCPWVWFQRHSLLQDAWLDWTRLTTSTPPCGKRGDVSEDTMAVATWLTPTLPLQWLAWLDLVEGLSPQPEKLDGYLVWRPRENGSHHMVGHSSDSTYSCVSGPNCRPLSQASLQPEVYFTSAYCIGSRPTIACTALGWNQHFCIHCWCMLTESMVRISAPCDSNEVLFQRRHNGSLPWPTACWRAHGSGEATARRLLSGELLHT